MFDESKLADIIDSMNLKAEKFGCEVDIHSYNLEEESFILNLTGKSWSRQFRFVCMEHRDEDWELVKMEISSNKNGWLMEPIPALMFAAMYAG